MKVPTGRRPVIPARQDVPRTGRVACGCGAESGGRRLREAPGGRAMTNPTPSNLEGGAYSAGGQAAHMRKADHRSRGLGCGVDQVTSGPLSSDQCVCPPTRALDGCAHPPLGAGWSSRQEVRVHGDRQQPQWKWSRCCWVSRVAQCRDRLGRLPTTGRLP
eukprot:3911211-Amphidinium_carterae.6